MFLESVAKHDQINHARPTWDRESVTIYVARMDDRGWIETSGGKVTKRVVIEGCHLIEMS